MNVLKVLTSCIGAYLLCVTPALADIKIGLHLTNRLVNASLVGEIKASDVQQFAQIADQVAIFDLNSNGGDVYAAMAIGKLVRENEAMTDVPEGGRCLSSCALIYIAGVERANEGVVGLHRPYLAGAPKETNDLRETVPKMLSDIKQYVASMGITENFYNILVNTEPSQMRPYPEDKIDALVPRHDPLEEEIEVARDARRKGITTTEYRQREIYAERCNSFSGVLAALDCRAADLWGLSEPVYKARFDEAKSKCILSDADQKTVDSQPRPSRMDHPLMLALDNCKRKVMLGK